MERIVRAMDVILPFDSQNISHEQSSHGTPDLPSPVGSEDERLASEVMSEDMASVNIAFPDGGEDIPRLDLGEKILAEQRRATARKRKGPGASEREPEPRPSEPVEESLPEMASPVETASDDDVVRLQQIVAEIVSRDIERLCHGLKRTPCCP